MKKAERRRLKGLLDYFRQQGGEGSAEVIAELEACLHQGKASEELLAAISRIIERNEKELARRKAEYAGRTLAAIFGDFLPIILPSLGRQTAGPKS